MNKEKYIDEIIEAAQFWAEDGEEAKFLLKLANSLEALNDEEFNKWVLINGKNIFKFLPDDSDLYKVASQAQEPKSWESGKPDAEKIFNDKNIATTWHDVPEERLKGLAEKNGYTVDQLKNALEEQETRQSRINQMYGTNWLQQIFTPRLYEKRLRDGVDVPIIPFFEDGALDTWKDLGLDIIENGLYTFNPFGRIGQLGRIANVAGKAGKVGKNALKGTEFLLGAGMNPLLMEGADAIAYDDPENDRSEFSWADVLNGTGTNIGAPLVLKGTAATIGKMLGGFGPAEKANKWIWNIGKGDLSSELETVRKGNERYRKMKEVIEKRGRSKFDENDLKWFDDWAKGYENAHLTTDEFEQILLSKGKDLDEKFRNYYKAKHGETETQTLKALKRPDGGEYAEELMDAVKKDRSDDVAKWFDESNYKHLNNKDLKSDKRILTEQRAMDFATNKYGDIEYDSDKNASMPIVGSIAKMVKEDEAEKKEKKAKRKAEKKLYVPRVEVGDIQIEAEDAPVYDFTDKEIEEFIEKNRGFWDIGAHPGELTTWGAAKHPEWENSLPVVAYRRYLKNKGGK